MSYTAFDTALLTDNTIEQLNAAKGSLRAKLHRGLFQVIKTFLISGCPCKEKALFAYCKGLDRTKIWPLEEHAGRKSIHQLLEGLRAFTYVPPDGACSRCANDFKASAVERTRRMVQVDFHGLCLDCMDASQVKDLDAAYWNQASEREWGDYCRLQGHGQPTWYFSFMGRKAEMDMYKERQRSRRSARSGFWSD